MTEKLLPCPYHGDPDAMVFASASQKYAACTKCDRLETRWYRPAEDWNSAYAWTLVKELAGAAAKIEAPHDLITKGNGYEEYHDADCRICVLQHALAKVPREILLIEQGLVKP